MPPRHVIYIVGRRHAGKSHTITRLIGDGASSTLIVFETNHDRDHHARHSSKATLCPLSEELPELDRFEVLAFDNVFFLDTHKLLQDALQSHAHTIIVTVSHPCSIPLSIPMNSRGTVIQLSKYDDLHGSESIQMLKATYAFQEAGER